MILYKFKPLISEENKEHIKDIIDNNRLHCANYKKLNDPFEGLFYEIVRSGGLTSSLTSS